MGFFEDLETEEYDRQYSDRQLAGRVWTYFTEQKRRMLLIIFTLVAMAAAGAALPVVVSRGVDLIREHGAAWQYTAIPLTVLGLMVFSWACNWVSRALGARVISDVILKLRTEAFASAARHDLSFYDQFSSGRILSRITSDTTEFGKLANLIAEVVMQIIESGIIAVILVRIEWRLALLVFLVIPIVYVLAYTYRKLARRVTRSGFRAMANVNAAIKETVSGIAVAKNFRQERGVYQEFDEANRQSYSVNVKRGLVYTFVFPTLNTIGGLMTAALVYFGGLTAAQGLITAGAWYLFLSSLDRFLYPVMNLSSFWTQVQTGLGAAERVFALIDAEPAVRQNDRQRIETVRGEIEFRNVCFRYSDKEQVLEDFSLCIHPGETIAVVGHTGAGKSSVAKLIARFYEFQEGSLRVDGHDIRSLDLDAYRSHLGIVSQVPFLFDGTVAENIRYARPQTSDAEIERLAHQIGSGDWLESLPQGLETQVGERGARLSMGQRQLVALMRVLVQRPAIFILDEATASIDPFTEWQIQQALNMILRDTTSILIAHRLSTVKSADRIIVMENGKIIEEGNHAGLLAQGGHYATLYNTYFRHQSLAYIEEARKEFLDEAAA